MEHQLQLNGEQSGLTVKDILYKYIRFLPLFIISLALALLIAYIYLRYTTPIYHAGGALIVKEDNNSGPTSGGGASGDRFQQMFVLDNSINIKNEIEIIRSKPLIKRVAEDLNLNLDYHVVGKIKESNIYTVSPIRVQIFEIADSTSNFVLPLKIENNKAFRTDDNKLYAFGQKFENDHGIFQINYNPIASLSEEYKVIWHPTDWVVDDILSRLAVAPGASAGVIQIEFEATNPQLASDFINTLMKEYQVATREDKNEMNRRMLDFIDERMKIVEKELDSITAALLKYQRDNNIINSETQSGSYFARLEETDKEINIQREEDYTAQMVADYLGNEENAYNLVPSNFGLKDATLSTLIGAYNVAQLERKELIDSKLPETNPRVIQKANEIEHLRLNVLESLRNLRKSIAASISRLEKLNARVLSQVRTLPLKEQNLLEIKTKQETKQTVYNLLLEKK